MANLLSLMGLGWESKQVRQDGQKIRVYKISSKKLVNEDRLVILECIARKWDKYLSDQFEKPDWSTVTDEVNSPSKSSTKTFSSKVPQTLTNKAFNPVTDDSVIVNKPKELSVTENSNPLDSSEAIDDLAEMLATLENAEQLAELQTVPEITVFRLRKAAKLLSLSQYQQIRSWAVHNRKSTA